MSSTRRRFSQEFKDELCHEVIDSSKPIKTVATENGVGAETKLNVSERALLSGMEREYQEAEGRGCIPHLR